VLEMRLEAVEGGFRHAGGFGGGGGGSEHRAISGSFGR
jgi:hypothetical protein